MTDSRRSILVIDDEHIIADTLALILANAGFQPHVAYDGVSGLEIARAKKPEIVLSDVILPGMNGVELATKIRQILPGSRIILFSGQAVTADMLESAKESGEEFEVLAKPVDPEELLSKLRDS